MNREEILSMSDDEVLDVITASIANSNRHIKIGERMTGPCAVVLNGKHYEPPSHEGAISLDFRPEHVHVPVQTIQCGGSMKIYFKELDTMEWSSFSKKWVYPYQAIIPHRKWLTEKKPGDEVMVIDDTWDVTPLILTEKHFIDHGYVLFRCAVSD